jgi:hypothetical protein
LSIPGKSVAAVFSSRSSIKSIKNGNIDYSKSISVSSLTKNFMLWTAKAFLQPTLSGTTKLVGKQKKLFQTLITQKPRSF